MDKKREQYEVNESLTQLEEYFSEKLEGKEGIQRLSEIFEYLRSLVKT